MLCIGHTSVIAFFATLDSSVSSKDEIWFLRMCHHISNAVYLRYDRTSVVLPVPTHFNDRPIAERILAMGGVRSSTAVLIDMQVFWDIAPYRLVNRYRSFEESTILGNVGKYFPDETA
jgi:hypothetical protein